MSRKGMEDDKDYKDADLGSTKNVLFSWERTRPSPHYQGPTGPTLSSGPPDCGEICLKHNSGSKVGEGQGPEETVDHGD